MRELAGFAKATPFPGLAALIPVLGKCLAKLELFYGVKFGKLWKGVGRRGRPAHSGATRTALKLFGRALCEFWKGGEVLVPEHPQPHQRRGLEDPLWPMACKWEQTPAMK